MKNRWPTPILYSSDYSSKSVDFRGVWSNWAKPNTYVTAKEIQRSGHFVAEEQPKQTYDAVMGFVNSVVQPQVKFPDHWASSGQGKYVEGQSQFLWKLGTMKNAFCGLSLASISMISLGLVVQCYMSTL